MGEKAVTHGNLTMKINVDVEVDACSLVSGSCFVSSFSLVGVLRKMVLGYLRYYIYLRL